jgi:CDP-Glycerol:Poly(glycerophosphate) glycerophosphotransferase
MIEFIASSSHYADHLAPIRDALPVDARGELLARLVRNGTAPIVSAASRDTRMAVRFGRPVAVTEHGYGQSYGNGNASYPGGKGLGAVSMFLAPNEYAASRWRSEYPRARVEVVGCPKLDALPPRDPGPGPVIAVSFHWDCHVAPESRSGWSHFKSALPLLAGRFTVLGHGHPRIIGKIAPIYRALGIEVIEDFREVCRRADLYVCDNSSTLYEFASTGRPVLVLNAPWYRRTANHGLRFWEAATVGVQCNDPVDLAALVELALVDRYDQRDARERALNLVYAVRHGAAQRAADVVLDWAREVSR